MKRHTLYVIWILLLSATFALAAQPQANGGFYDTAIAEGDTLADRKPILHHVFWNVNYYDLWVEGRKEVRDYYENFQVKLLDARQLEGQSGPSALMYYDGQNNLLHTISPGQLRNLESDRISQILVNAAIFAERKNKGGGYKQILSEDSLRSALVLLADISPAEMTGALRVFTESVRPVEQLAPQTLEVLFTHYTDYNDPFYAGLVGQFLRLEKLPEEQEIIAKYRDVVSAGAATANREVLPVAAEILGLLDVRAGRPFQPQKNADLADILYRYFSGDCGERELAAHDFAAKWLIKYSYAWQLEADSVYSKKTISKISRLAIKAGYGLGIANEHLAAQTDQVSWLVKSLKGRKHLLFGYKDSLLHKKPYRKLKQDFKSQFEEELESDMPARMADAPPNKQQIYINQQMKSFRRFLRKKKGGSKYNDIDFNLGPFGGFGDLNDHWLLMGTKRKGYIRLTFTPGQYSITELLPIVEQEEECGPFDFVMDNGNLMKSSLAPFRYRPYMPSSRTGQVIEREVRFEKDKASLDALYLKDIVAVMKDQDFTVLGVEVRAFASVEGDSLRNVGLFHRRANAVLNYLRRYNDEDIALDTLIVNEQWEMFANQLKNSDYARLGLLSRDSLRAWLAISENAQSVEHLLAPQRKAILKIRLARRLSHREKMDKVLEGVYKTAEMMDREKTESRLFELGRLYMGMLHYIQNTVTDGRLAQSDADALFNDLARTHTWHNYFAYYLAVTNMERGMSGASVADIETLTLRAFTDCRAGLPNRFYMKAVEDIQARTIEMIQTGQISPCVLDGFAYPMQREYFNLIAHKTHFVIDNRDTPGFFDCREKEVISGNDSPSPTEDTERCMRAKPEPYYYLVRDMIDGERPVANRAFYLYYLLNINVKNREEFNGIFYDPELDMAALTAYAKELAAAPGRLCKKDVQNLLVGFYTQNVRYFASQFPVDARHKHLLAYSLRYLYGYYISVAQRLSPQQVDQVVQLFMYFNGAAAHNEYYKYAQAIQARAE